MSLYTKYRPRDWDSVIDQDAIVTILKSSLQNNSTSHAYMFTGSRWTGKTTSARILAKALNCTNLKNGNPCHQCESCQMFDNNGMVDVIEIDAASNTGVDNIRDLIESARSAPMFWKYKIYIIDEVHMLSAGAFNALLKTLEEPPVHVKFILATTDIHKVPETVQSRTHRFDFNKITLNGLLKRLKFVAENEWIIFEEWTLEIIAKIARGGMRDALTMLEQYSIDKKLQLSYLRSSLSLLDDKLISDIIEILREKKIDQLQEVISQIVQHHIQTEDFFDQILLTLRDKMKENLANEKFLQYNAIFLIFRTAYSSLKTISDHSLLLEITLMQAINWQFPWTQTTAREKVIIKENPAPILKYSSPELTTTQKSKITNLPPLPEKIEEKIKIDTPKIEEKPITNIPQKTEQNENNIAEIKEFSYTKLLTALKSKPAILATLKTANFKINGTHLDFIFPNKWNAWKLNETEYQTSVISALESTFGWNWTIASHHNSTPTNSAADFIDEVF